MSSPAQVLTPGVGAAVVVSVAIGLSMLMLVILFCMRRYSAPTEHSNDNDEFSSASRSVKPGLVACAIVSAWTWAATLQQSAAVAYKWGISGPFWYAAGASMQVFLFAIIGSCFKLNAPFANTFLSLIRARWGTLAHCIYICFALTTNVLVSSMLILGGSAAVESLTGLNIYVSIFITPIGLTIFVLLGGLRSSFIADYSHTAVLLAILLAFAFTVYASSDKIGSFAKMVELLSKAPPVEGNAEGSYLTFRSLSGLSFGIINIMGNLGALFLDQSYHQRVIASRGETATKGFILGGIAWIAVPLGVASCLGLAARALAGQDPAMAVLTADQVSQGLPAPAAAAALLGKSGALMMLFLLFLAVTSAASAQLVAVSSVFTFDIYQPYIDPQASAKRLFFVSHTAVIGWALIMGVLGDIWHHVGVSMGWLYTAMGIIIGAAVVPVMCCICWSKANRKACIAATLLGEAFALTAWIVTAYKLEGDVTITSTSADGPLLAANIIAVLSPVLIIVPVSLMYPDNYDWQGTRAINAPQPVESNITTQSPDEQSEKEMQHPSSSSSTSLPDQPPALLSDSVASQGKACTMLDDYDSFSALRKAGIDVDALFKSRSLAINLALPITFVLLIVVPCMAIIPKVWTAAGLGVWVTIIIAWLFVSFFCVVVYPVWESRAALSDIAAGIWRDVSGRS